MVKRKSKMLKIDDKIRLKEGSSNNLQFKFMVHNDIVWGLKLTISMKGAMSGVEWSRDEENVGSWSPQSDMQMWDGETKEVPGGFTVRGNYKCVATLVDIAGVQHAQVQFPVEIAKDW